MAQLKTEKVIFYTSLPRLFRATLIGYLYEISQVYHVVLLSEELDEETKNILSKKELFPGLEKVIQVRQYTDKRRVLSLGKNRYLKKAAKKIIKEENPDIVILENDFYFFEMCLLRYACNALKICFRPCFQLGPKKEERLWSVLKNAHKMPAFMPFFIRKGLAELKKYLAHFLYYVILPLAVFERPFFGKSSCFLTADIAGLRQADYSTVLSQRDYDLVVTEGLPKERVHILPHPLELESRKFLEKAYSFNKDSGYNKIITFMYSDQGSGIRKEDNSFISSQEQQKTIIRIVSVLAKEFSDWAIFIKPHPVTNNFKELVDVFSLISSNIKVARPSEPADKFIEKSSIIIGTSPSSNSLFTASLQNPEKIILSLDFDKELLGDSFKDFAGIEYIDNEEDFIKILKDIKNNDYKKKSFLKNDSRFFKSSVELIEYVDNLRSSKTV